MAKRVPLPNVNWLYIMENLPPVEIQKVSSLKLLYDKYLKEVTYEPTALPKIDWDSYRKKILTPGMVDSFQKAYESLNIPFPSDQGVLAETDKVNSELMSHANETHQKVLASTSELKNKLKELESVMKYSDMTLEELVLALPHLDVTKETIWPLQFYDLPEDKEKNH